MEMLGVCYIAYDTQSPLIQVAWRYARVTSVSNLSQPLIQARRVITPRILQDHVLHGWEKAHFFAELVDGTVSFNIRLDSGP